MPRSYTVISLATGFLASACIVAICFIMDPYKLYPAVPGLSPETSVDLFYLMRLHTPYDVDRVRPSILVMGDSRAAALPPQMLQQPDEIAYNASLPGATLREIRSMVEHAHANSPLKRVVIGLDLPMFQAGNSNEMVLDERHRYRKLHPSWSQKWHHGYQRLEDYWRSLFSVDAMMDVWRIVFGRGPSKMEFGEDGTWDLDARGKAPPRELYGRLVRKTYKAQIADKSVAIEFGELTELLDFTETNGIQTILFIMPMQGLLLNTIEFAGGWKQYIDWQHELVTRVNARSKTDTVIYGVEDQPGIVLETIGAPQHLFRDGVHLNRRAGTEIFTCLAGPCKSAFQLTRLDSHSIDTYLEQVDAMRRQYAQDNPADIAQARRWIALD